MCSPETAAEEFDELSARIKRLEGRMAEDPQSGEPYQSICSTTCRKKVCYEEYRAVRKEMLEYGVAKQNVDKIMGIEQPAGGHGWQKDRE